MVKNIGIDIIEVERFRKIVARGDDFAQKVLTEKIFCRVQRRIFKNIPEGKT